VEHQAADKAVEEKTKKEIVLDAISVVQHLSELFFKRRLELASEVGLTEQQWLFLERIADEHFMPSMFAKERASSPAAVSKILRRLTEKGLIAAGLSAQDARKRVYRLTEAGMQTMAALRASRARAIDRIWMGLDAKSLSTFCDFGAQLTASIESYSKKMGR
jgi:DNA-binding MarR family transcriptional regulator